MSDDSVSLSLFVEAYDKASSVFGNISNALDAMGKKFSDTGKMAAAAGADQEAANAKAQLAARNHQAALNDLSVAQQNVKDIAAKSSAEMGAATAAEADALAKLKSAEDNAAKAATDHAKAEDQASQSHGKSKLALDAVAVAAGGTALAVGDFAVHAVKSATEFQSAMEVSVTQAGMTKQAADAMGQRLIQLGPEVGQTSTALANAFYHIASVSQSMGLTASQQYDMMKVAAEGAAVGHSDLTTTTNALIAAVTSGIGGVHGYTDAMGQMNAIVGQGNMKMQDLATAMSSGGLSMAKAYGVDLPSLGAALATMTNQGVPADVAMTRLKMTIATIGGPTKQSQGIMESLGVTQSEITTRTQAMSDALAKSGVKYSELAADMKQPNGISVALQDLKKHFEEAGVSADEQSAIITRAFGGGKMGSTIVQLYNSLGQLDNAYKGITKGGADFQKSWEETSNSAEFQEKKLKASLDAIQTSIGMALLPTFQKLLNIIMDVLKPITDWITHNKDLAATILLIVGAVGGFVATLIIVAKFIVLTRDAILTMRAAVLALNESFLLNPIVLIIMAIIAVVLLMATHWKETKQIIEDVWNWMKSAAQDVADFFVGLWNGVVNFFEEVWNKILQFVKDWWPLLLGVVTGGVGLIVGVIIKYHNDIWAFIQNIWNTILNFFKQIWDTIYNVYVTVLTTIRDFMVRVWTDEYNFIVSIWNTIYGFLKAIWDTLYNTISATFTAIRDFVQRIWNDMWNAVQNAWNTIYTWLKNTWDTTYNTIVNIFTNIRDTIQRIWNDMWNAVQNVWNTITGWLNNIWTGLRNSASSVFTGIQNVIQGVWDNIKSAATTMWNAIVQGISTAWNAIKAVVRDPINVVIKLVDDFIGGAKTVLDAVGVHILDSVHINPVAFATGGVLPGYAPGQDTVPAMLSPGEGILTPQTTRALGGVAGITRLNNMGHKAGSAMVQQFADGGVVVSGGMSGGVFHGSWHDDVNGVTYQDTDPSGGHFVDANTLTGYVNGTGSPSQGGQSIIGSAVGAVAGAVGNVASAIKGLAVGFIKGALIAAAHLALDPMKLAVDHAPDSPMAAAMAKGTAEKGIQGIFDFISSWDSAHGTDPAASGNLGNANPADVLKYAIATFAGLPYTWGNNDCSGIVQKAYAHFGVSLPRTSSAQWSAGSPVDLQNTIAGDLAFYNPGTSGAPAGLPGHVGFVVDHNTIFDAYNTSKPIGYDPIGLPGNTLMGFRHVAQAGGGSFGSPSGTVADWIHQALSAEGWPADWAGAINTIIQRESGGNPNAINLTDVNAQHGDPSKGLMQVIYPTFETWRDPKLPDNQFDPIANIVAAVRYILNRYGSVAAVASRPGGYEYGTFDTGPTAHMAMLHPHEAVIPANMNGRGLGGQTVINVTGNQIMSDASLDALIDRIEKRWVQQLLPGAGHQMRI